MAAVDRRRLAELVREGRGRDPLSEGFLTALRADGRTEMQSGTSKATTLLRIYKIKLESAKKAGTPVAGGEELLKELAKPGLDRVSIFYAQDRLNTYALFTDEPPRRVIALLQVASAPDGGRGRQSNRFILRE